MKKVMIKTNLFRVTDESVYAAIFKALHATLIIPDDEAFENKKIPLHITDFTRQEADGSVLHGFGLQAETNEDENIILEYFRVPGGTTCNACCDRNDCEYANIVTDRQWNTSIFSISKEKREEAWNLCREHGEWWDFKNWIDQIQAILPRAEAVVVTESAASGWDIDTKVTVITRESVAKRDVAEETLWLTRRMVNNPALKIREV